MIWTSPLRPGKYPCHVRRRTSWERFAHTCFATALSETWVGTGVALVPVEGVADVPPDDVHVAEINPSAARTAAPRTLEVTPGLLAGTAASS
jgi:hypothetical protein